MWWTGLLCAFALSAQDAAPPAAPVLRIEAVRHWVLADTVRISIEVSGEFHFRRDRLSNPDRIYFDIVGAKPAAGSPRVQTIAVGDRLLKQIRISETQPGVTRVVLDLDRPVDYSAAQLANPDRLIIELRPEAKSPAAKRSPPPPAPAKPSEPTRETSTIAAAGPPPAAESKSQAVTAKAPAVAAPVAESKPAATVAERPKAEPARPEVQAAAKPADVPAHGASGSAEPITASVVPPVSSPAKETPAAVAPAAVAKNAETRPALPPLASTPSPASVPAAQTPPQTAAANPQAAPVEPPAVALPASKSRVGNNSLVRALGLKLQRVVIDPGHGGHDTGTIGRGGLMEKDLVLDVARRLGALIEERLGAEVVYTRTEDVFVPLEERTALANERRADLFLSIHANAGVSSATGTETYYLNFTTSKAAMEVAARENASSQRSIHELQSLIEKIALKDKVDESREFAARVQTALVKELARTNPNSRDRGVRKAPFVVLIGASMPSVLAEIAFLSNAREEKLLARPDYRQKIAEGLYKGVSQYASTLSRYQLAEKKP